MTGKKHEKPLYLDMDFGEALQRFAKTEKKEVDKSIKRAKEKKPPEDDPSSGKRTSNRISQAKSKP